MGISLIGLILLFSIFSWIVKVLRLLQTVIFVAAVSLVVNFHQLLSLTFVYHNLEF